MSQPRMLSRILRGTKIAALGDLGKFATHDNVKKLVEANGGTWIPDLSGEITHLVTSKEEWTKQSPELQAIEKQNAHIVNFHWLEKSTLASKTGLPFDEQKYSFKYLEQNNAKVKKSRRAREREEMGHTVDKFMSGKRAALGDLRTGMSPNSPSTNGEHFTGRITRMLAFVRGQAAAAAVAAAEAQVAAPKPSKRARGRDTDDPDGEPPKKRRAAAPRKRTASGTPQGGKQRAGRLNAADRKRLADASKPPRKRRPAGFSAAAELDKVRPDPRGVAEAAAAARVWMDELRDALLLEANADWPFPDKYHLYRDQSGRATGPRCVGASAVYMAVTLVRPLLMKNQARKVNMRLYESDSEPRAYATCLRSVSEMKDRELVVLAPEGSEWTVAWKAFTHKFRELTGVEWAERQMATAGTEKQLADGQYFFGGFMITI